MLIKLTVIDINKSEFSNNNAGDGGGFYAENTYTPPGNTPSGVPVSFRNSVFNSNKGIILDQISKVLLIESPISKNLLCKRICVNV